VEFTNNLGELYQRVPDLTERESHQGKEWTHARVQLASSRRWSAVRATRTNKRESFALRFVSMFPGDEKNESGKDGNGNGEKKKKNKKGKREQNETREEFEARTAIATRSH
jgi:hypothetical protein